MISPEKEKQLRLEESFLHEFGAMSQCYKFATMTPSRCIENAEDHSEKSAQKGQFVISNDEISLKNHEVISQ